MRYGRTLVAIGATLAVLAGPVGAADRTSNGKVSIAMIAEALKKADADEAARNLLIVYISGVVESMMAMDERFQQTAGRRLICKSGEGRLDAPELEAAFRKAAPDPKTWGEAEAAPALIAHLVAKYPCR